MPHDGGGYHHRGTRRRLPGCVARRSDTSLAPLLRAWNAQRAARRCALKKCERERESFMGLTILRGDALRRLRPRDF